MFFHRFNIKCVYLRWLYVILLRFGERKWSFLDLRPKWTVVQLSSFTARVALFGVLYRSCSNHRVYHPLGV